MSIRDYIIFSKYIYTHTYNNSYRMEKCIYIYERVINLSKEYRSMNLKKEKKSKASKTCSKTLPSPFDTRSTNNAFNVVGKYSLVGGGGGRSTDKISIPPLLVAVRKIRNRRFAGCGEGGSRVSATHINRFARRTASKRWLTDGKEGEAPSAGIRV